MLSDEQVDKLLSTDEPGKLTNLDGSARIRERTTPEQAAQRREAVSKMLMAGHSLDRIVEVMSRKTMVVKRPDGTSEQIAGFGLEHRTTLALINEVRRRWQDEEEEEAPYRRMAAIRRNKAHIEKAAAKGQYGAVAALEANLTKMEGTAEPIRVEVSNVGREMDEALMHVLGEMDPDQFRELVASERTRLIDTDGESVD